VIKSLFLAFFLLSALVGEAKNTMVIKISCTIPPVVELKSASVPSNTSRKKEETLTQDSIIQLSERVENGKKVIIKTVLLR
jgi:hypothetical protein